METHNILLMRKTNLFQDFLFALLKRKIESVNIKVTLR